MTPDSLARTIDERLAFIDPIVEGIEQGGGESDLRDLRLLLIDTIGLLKRDPGIEAAAEDLYAAAAALVSDSTASSQPLARKLRLLRTAHDRLRERLSGAAERVGPQERPRLQGFAALYAAQLALGVALADIIVDNGLNLIPGAGA
jgi:hypothetical protein